MKHWFLKLIFCVTYLCSTMHAVVLVKGDVTIPAPPTTPTTFSNQITAKVLDHATGNFYVGLLTPASPNYSISKIGRFSGVVSGAQPAFSPIATKALVSGQAIDF